MSANFRTLIPAITPNEPADADEQTKKEPQQTRLILPPRRRVAVPAACNRCRAKKHRCSGERPICGKCGETASKCVYDGAPGQTRAASLRLKYERMETDRNAVMELYWFVTSSLEDLERVNENLTSERYLQTQPADNVAKALAAIQSGADPGQVVDTLNASGMSTYVPPDNNSRKQHGKDIQRLLVTTDGQKPAAGGVQSSQSEKSVSLGGIQEQLSSGDLCAAHSSIFPAIRKPLNAVDALESGTQAFFSYTSCIFYIGDHGEAQDQLKTIRTYLEDAGDNWAALAFRDSMPTHIKALLCPLCVMAAIGLQYTKDAIPALGFEPSGRSGEHQYVTIFYRIAKQLMESAIEHNPLEALKVCAAMCVFNIIGHATIALTYAEMGINLGNRFQSCPDSVNESTWVNYKRVESTLVTLRNWLMTTLGYLSSKNPTPLSAIYSPIDRKDMSQDEIIQQESGKVLQLEANILRALKSSDGLLPEILGSAHKDLTQWYEQLPHWMCLNALVESHELGAQMRRTVLLVHLYYLSANILVARLAHGGPESSPPLYDIEEVRISTSHGVLAARAASQILQLQLDEGSIFQRCWVCEFTAYMSCLVLLYSVAKMLLHGLAGPVWQKELFYAKSCLDVLEFCGKSDHIALHFTQEMRHYYITLAAQAQQDIDLSTVKMPESCDYLFAIPEPASPYLGQLSQELFKKISCPFGYPSDMHTESTFKTGFGTQLEWNLFANLPADRYHMAANSVSAFEAGLSGIESGHFLGSSRPHGWESLTDLNKL